MEMAKYIGVEKMVELDICICSLYGDINSAVFLEKKDFGSPIIFKAGENVQSQRFTIVESFYRILKITDWENIKFDITDWKGINGYKIVKLLIEERLEIHGLMSYLWIKSFLNVLDFCVENVDEEQFGKTKKQELKSFIVSLLENL
jgi:hypothetical protein